MMALDANFSLPAAKPPAQKIGVAGWDAKVFSADSAPQLPPAPTPEQLMARQFPPEVMRFYLTKRQAEQIHAPASVEGEVWRYAWGERVRDVKLPMPQDGQDIEQAAVAEIAAVEGIEPDRARLYVAQVCSANWGEFVRFAAGAAEQQAPAPAAPQPGIPPFLLNLLNQTPTIRQMPPAAPQNAPTSAEKDAPATHAAAQPENAPEAQTGAEKRFPIVHPPYGSAPEVLKRAAQLLQERGQQYDATFDEAPHEARERSMARTVETFNALHGTRLTEAQGWSFMLCLKLVRLFCAPGFHADSADDAVAYAALLGEGKAREV